MNKSASLFVAFVFAALLLLPANLLWAKAHVLIVGGLGGNADYAESFGATINDIEKNFTPGSQWLGQDTALTVLSGGDASKANILAALQSFANDSSATDSVVLMLVGHGSYDGEHYRFNIPGPDLKDIDLKRVLATLKAEQQLVVLATSASGIMLQQLARPGRTVITATKSGGEINAVVFPQYWAAALTTDRADFDRNEIVTVGEAFRYTRNAVEAHYKEQNLLASEHARIDGAGAQRQPVALIGSLQNSGNNPEVARLLKLRADLESEFTTLVARKGDMASVDYYASLQELMLRLARLQLDIDRETGWVATSE